MPFKKISHDKAFKLEYEGEHWTVDLAEWFDEDTGKGELRVYRIEGNITSPNLNEALEIEANARAMTGIITKL